MPPFLSANEHPAILALADGTVFKGFSIGAAGYTSGEVVFNTAMTGYQEILTDPSYSRQLVTLTYPHIGNTGVNAEDVESNRIHAAGLIIRDLPLQASNFRSTQSLSDYLKAENIVAIAGIDTRKLTRILREKGAQGGSIVAGPDAKQAVALEHAEAFAGLAGVDLAKVVSTKKSYEWTQTEWLLGRGYSELSSPKFHVVAFDYGVKFNILPFGICLGHQIMALASGAKTIKMKFGHHGANHPVQDLDTKKVMITSQNHGFAVDPNTLPSNCRVTHVSLFDNSLQGFERTDRPAFCFQGHPEASPGPHDIAPLFDRFVAMMEKHKHG
ncbi:MAG: carbamoyl-phosphate synthase small subunit [Oxalobacteraceae bacterium]|nr:carbamoyl-phosphate synthase small subunit [Oxalobacteraceae bacterium]